MEEALRFSQLMSARMLGDTLAESSRDLIKKYILSLPSQDIIKILTPVKSRLLTEDTVLHINTMNFSLDHVLLPMTVKEVLEILGPNWKRWIHNASSLAPPGAIETEMSEHIRTGAFESIDVPPTDFVREFIESLTKKQKQAMTLLIKDGLLTDESFMNVGNYTGPDRVQVSMKKVVDILSERERRNLDRANGKYVLIRLLFMQHYSSANFEKMKKTDLDVSHLRCGRQKMSIWYTICFALTTLATFFSHIWSNVTNFETMQSQLQVTLAILVVASLAIGGLMYLVTYEVAFLFCCENSMSKSGLKHNRLQAQPAKVFKHFSSLHQFKKRIIATKVLQFLLLWYTMLLAVYAHENDLNIYPSLTCVLTNGFGLMLFARISHFFSFCRVSPDKNILYSQ
ncbi:hypothetical protein FO519_000768 [Halicephalobus sp. NKZ332]|nr:hypothetical protein FO519_000768 [Halicephalobus sp. NKZ332]